MIDKSNTEKKDDTIFVKDLAGKSFFIPAYQRGYRWTESEVSMLLDDINDFQPKDAEKYCLQPLIVKKRPQEDNSYEVVDGQQRLTTIFMILKYVFDVKNYPDAKPAYEIQYATRKRSRMFLGELSGDSEKEADDNIDFHYMFSAWKGIKAWFDNNNDVRQTDLANKLMDKVTFIWYEISETEEPIELFARENTGKIPLTSAELIKALLLSGDHFPDAGREDDKDTRQYKQELKHKQQIEMSLVWEYMERTMNDDSFWFFLSNQENMETRIDLLFNVLAKKYLVGMGNTNSSFRVLNHKLKESSDKEQCVKEIWRETIQCFSEFNDWYNDPWKYHIVGFLIAVEGKSKECIVHDLWHQISDKKKSEVRGILDDRVKEVINHAGLLDELDYQSHKEKIREILLLFNLVSVLQKREECEEKQGRSPFAGHYRFPFERYKSEKWDIEHIHAIADKLPQNIKDITAYFHSLSDSLEKQGDDKCKECAGKIRRFIESPESQTMKQADKFYGDIMLQYSNIDELCPDDSLGNLALLDAATNRGYKNATFFSKRKSIIDRERNGQFVPLCTKNVFLKLYSDSPENLYRWTDLDREQYIRKIEETLKPYLFEEK